MLSAIRQGGWPMLLLLAIQVPGLLLAIVYAIDPRRWSFAGALGCAVAQLFLGGFGTVFGYIHVFSAVAGADPSTKATLLAAGISEALNCAAFSLGYVLLWAVPFFIGVARGRRQKT